MGLRYSHIAAVEAILAAGLFALAIPGTITAFHERATTVRLDAAASETASERDWQAVQDIEPQSAFELKEQAFALIGGSEAAPIAAIASAPRLERGGAELRAYLARVPSDSRAWGQLAYAESRLGHAHAAAAALKMSILTGPWLDALVLWRCRLGVDLYSAMDDEGRDLLRSQFRVAASRAPAELARSMTTRYGLLVTRILLSSSPDELTKFEAALVARR